MDWNLDTEITAETSRLLAELDDALNQCSVMRDIIAKYERLHSLECVTGPSCKTRMLRKEIELMERNLSLERCR